MKLSEKYLQSKTNGHGGLCLNSYEAGVFGEIIELEEVKRSLEFNRILFTGKYVWIPVSVEGMKQDLIPYEDACKIIKSRLLIIAKENNL